MIASGAKQANTLRRAFLAATTIAAYALAMCFPAQSFAQTAKFPSKQIKILVGYPAGGAIDGVLRVMAHYAERDLGQPIVLEYKPGAGSVVSLVQAKNSAPDGYTLVLITKGAFRAPAVENVAYDPIKDLSYIVGLADLPFGIVVRGDAPWKTWGELVDYGKAHPEEMHYGAAGGWGNSAHLYMEEITAEAKVKWNVVPYKGTADAEQALLGGQIRFSVNGSVGGGLLEAGRLRLLAVAGEQRSSRWPDVPTTRELGYRAFIDSRWGLAAPKGVTPEVAKRIQDAFKKALDEAEVKAILQRYGQSVSYMSYDEYNRYAIRAVEDEGVLVRKHGFGKKQ